MMSEAAARNFDVPSEVRNKVREYLVSQLAVEPDFPDSARLVQDLGMDSLEIVALQAWIEEEFIQPWGDFRHLHTVEGAFRIACGLEPQEGQP